MARQIRLRTIRRKEIDEDKLALAFWLLAKSLEEASSPSPNLDADPRWPEEEVEAA